jgi:hypothetical protein
MYNVTNRRFRICPFSTYGVNSNNSALKVKKEVVAVHTIKIYKASRIIFPPIFILGINCQISFGGKKHFFSPDEIQTNDRPARSLVTRINTPTLRPQGEDTDIQTDMVKLTVALFAITLRPCVYLYMTQEQVIHFSYKFYYMCCCHCYIIIIIIKKPLFKIVGFLACLI